MAAFRNFRESIASSHGGVESGYHTALEEAPEAAGKGETDGATVDGLRVTASHDVQLFTVDGASHHR